MANQEHHRSTDVTESASSVHSGSDAPSEPGLNERDAFRIACLRNVRYHEDRERFFGILHRTAMFVVVAGGMAFFTALYGGSGVFVAIITLAGLFDLVFDSSGKARLHAGLRIRFFDLLAQNAAGMVPVKKLIEQSIRIYADEPPCMHAANALAYNNAMLSLDRPHKYLFKIDYRHKWFRHVWSFASADFKTFAELATSNTPARPSSMRLSD